MPYRRRNFRRRYKRYRKGSWRRKQKRYANRGQTGVRFFKLRYIVDVASSSSTFVISAAANNDVTMSPDWSSIVNLFDSYRCAALKIKYTPVLPNDESSLTLYRPAYVFGDVDTPLPSAPTPGSAIQYENCKVVNLARPFKYYLRIPKISYVAGSGIMLQGGWLDVASPIATSSITLITAQDYSADKLYGQFLVTMYVMAKNRR